MRSCARLQLALQISISCRHVSSFEQRTFLPRRRLKPPSVLHAQDRRRWRPWLAVESFPGSDDLVGSSSEEPAKNILNMMKTHLKDLLKGIQGCFPHLDGSGEWTENKFSSPPGCGELFIQKSRLWRLPKPKVPYTIWVKD